MAGYDYLIVGGGMTADAAARGIRERDKLRLAPLVPPRGLALVPIPRAPHRLSSPPPVLLGGGRRVRTS